MNKSSRKLSRLRALSAAVTVAASLSSSLHHSRALGDNLYWDPTGSASTSGGGGGTWDNLNSVNWFDTSLSTPIDVQWNNSGQSGSPDTAIYGSGSGTVNLGASITVGGITFSTGTNYTINGNGNTLTLAGTTPTIEVDDPSTPATINSAIADIGSAGLTKTGTGTLILAATNSYTGLTIVNAGTLTLNAGSAIQSSSGLIINGGTVQTGTYNVLGTGPITPVTINAGGLLTQTAAFNVNLDAVTLNGGELGSNGLYDPTYGSYYLHTDINVTGSTPSTIGASAVTAGGSINFNIASGSTLNVTGYFSNLYGNFGLTQNGSGLMVLSNSNTYTGATTVNGGTLQIGNGGTSGSLSTNSSITVNSPAVLAFDRANNVTQGVDYTGGGINGSGGVTQMGTGTLTFNTADGYTGVTTVNSGTLALNANGAIQNSSGLVINGGTVQTGAFNVFGTGPIIPVTINAGGLLTQTAAFNVNLGSVTLNGGELGSNGIYDPTYGSYYLHTDINVTGSTPSTISASAVTAGGAINFNINSGSTLNVTGYFSNLYGNFGLTQNGAGLMVLSNSNTYTGATTVNGGTLQIGNGGTTGSLSPNSGITINNSAVLTFDRSNNVTQGVDFSGGSITGTGGVTQTGTGTLTLNTVNGYTGPTTVNAGTLALTAQSAIQASSGLIINGGTVQTSTFNVFGTGPITPITINAGGLLTQTAAFNVNLGAVTLNGGELGSNGIYDPTYGSYYLHTDINVTGINTFDNQRGSAVTAGGPINFNIASGSTLNVTGYFSNLFGNFGLTQTGSGVIILANANTYTGGTTIQGGTLILGTISGNTGSLAPTGIVTLGNGTSSGILQLGDASNPVNQTIAGLFVAGTGNANAVVGGNSAISTLTVSNTVPDTFSGVLGGAGTNNNNLALVHTGANPLSLSGSNTYTGATTVSSGASSPTSPQLILANPNGAAIQGNLTIGNVSLGGSGVAVVQTTQPGQFGPNSAVTFDASSGNWAYLQLLENNQTVAGLNDSDGNGIIEDTESQTSYMGATLTVNGSGSYNGYMRNNAGGSGVLSLVKSGAGTLTLAGGNINYTGATTISAGTLFLQDTSGYQSSTSIAGGTTFNVAVSSGTLTVAGTYAITGTGLLVKSGPGNWTIGAGGAQVNMNMTGGQIDIQGGTIQDNYVRAEWTNNQASINVANTATLDMFSDPVNLDALTGSGTVQNGYAGNGIMLLTVGNNNTQNSATYGITNNTGVFSGVIGPTGTDSYGVLNLVAVNKVGTGTQVLTGSNTYSGPTTITAGTLVIGGGGTLGGGAYGAAITNDAALVYASSANQIFSGGISGTGSLTVSGTGTLTLTNGNGSSGLTTVNSGTLALNANGAIQNSSGLVINGGTVQTGAFNVFGTGPFVPITINAGGLLTQTAAFNVNLGSVTLNGGELGSNGIYDPTYGSFYLHTDINVTGSTPSTISASSVTAGGPINFNIASGSTLNVTGYFSNLFGGFSLTQNGSGLMVLSNSNTYTGATTVNGGTLQIGNGGTTGSLSPNSSITVNSPAVLVFDRSNNVTQGVDYTGGGINGSGGVTQMGTGTLTFTTANAYTGPTTVNAGTLALNAGSAIQASSGLIINGGTVQTSTFNVFGTGPITPITINAGGLLTQTAAFNVNLGSVTLNGGELGSNGLYDPTYGSYYLHTDINVTGSTPSTISASAVTAGGPINFNVASGSTLNVTGYFSNLFGNFGLTQNGSGVINLSNSNTYAGGTIVNGGTLRANNATGSATGSGTVAVSAGGTLGGSGSLSGAITVNSGGLITAGPDNATTGLLTSTGGITLNGGSGYVWKVNNNPVSGGVAGTSSGWDELSTQGINFTGISSGTPFTVYATGSTWIGATGTYTYIIATDPALISINGSNLPNGPLPASEFPVDLTHFVSYADTDSFQLELVPDSNDIGQDLALVETAIGSPGDPLGGNNVPEPSALGLLGVASLGLLRRAQKTRRRSPAGL